MSAWLICRRHRAPWIAFKGRAILYTGSPSWQTIDGCVCNGLMSTESGKLISTKLSFQMNHASICGTMMAAFVLDAIQVNAAFQSGHPELWFGVRFRIMDNPICYELRQDNTRPHIAKTVRDFCSAQHMHFLPWPAYSPDMSPIEHLWDLVGQRLARDPRPAASKYELLLRIQAIWNSLPQVHIQNLTPCHVV
ncbi:transposable element Tcb2 transposase [Trichonephila clavipes]|nr:transposable element Tcb2 transposase [Trichonephila clavipes]